MRTMGNTLSLAAAVGTLFTGAAVAQTTGSVSALKGHNSDSPVDVTADRIEVQDRAKRALWSGNVKVRQDELSLDSSKVILNYSTDGGIKIHRLDASGGVIVRSPSETARGDFGIYDLDRKLITLIGNVNLVRNGSSVSGSRLLIDLNSGRAVIDGGAPEAGQSGGRVTGRFLVPKRSK